MGEHHGIEQPDPPRDGSRTQGRDRGQQIGEEKDRAEGPRTEAEAEMEPPGEKALRDQAARKGIEREEGREPEDGPLRSSQPEKAARPRAPGQELDRGREPREKKREQNPEPAVQHDRRAIAGRLVMTAREKKARQRASGERAG